MAHWEDECTTTDGVLNMFVASGDGDMAERMVTFLGGLIRVAGSTALGAEP